jgi:NitT/TauT family transport system ATP-binding protein
MRVGNETETVALRLSGVTKRFVAPSGESYTAIEGINLDIREGAFVSVVGPSGCGKSTLLHISAGLNVPSDGTIQIYGEPLAGINRRASYMFQQDALLPWKTVLDNVVLGLTFRNRNRGEREDIGRTWLDRVGLTGFADHFPYQLSGGMRKRVAMAQSWIVNPDMLLMDEPFSALDIHTRHMMETELLNLWSGSRKTALFVTHDLEEAIALADEVVVLSAGPASRIIGQYPVHLPRPRELMDIRTEPRFTETYRSIWSDLRGEVLKSYAQPRE